MAASLPTLRVADADVEIVEYRGERVVTFKQVDRVHSRPDGTAKRNFNENRTRFQDGADFIELTSDEIRTMSAQGVFPARSARGTLLTRRGYLKLVKSLNDDRAWDVYGEMVDAYFHIEHIVGAVTALSQDEGTKKLLGGMIKRNAGKAMREALAEAIPTIVGEVVKQIATDNRNVVTANVSVREILDGLKVPSKKRRSLQARCYNRLSAHCRLTGIIAVQCVRTNTWLWPAHEATTFVREHCADLIREHRDALDRQGRLKLVPREPVPKSPPA